MAKGKVSRSDPFQFVGLDYLGPINVRERSELTKAWVCLFTCLTVRAIHLKWVTDLTAAQLNIVIKHKNYFYMQIYFKSA